MSDDFDEKMDMVVHAIDSLCDEIECDDFCPAYAALRVATFFARKHGWSVADIMEAVVEEVKMADSDIAANDSSVFPNHSQTIN